MIGVFKTIHQVQVDHIKTVLEAHKGNITDSALALGLSRAGLYSKMRRWGIENVRPEEAKPVPEAV